MKNKKNTELAVCGLAAVKALGKEHPERIKRFYYEGGRAGVLVICVSILPNIKSHIIK